MDNYGNINNLDMLTAMSFALTIHNTELAESHSREIQELHNLQKQILEKLENIERSLNIE